MTTPCSSFVRSARLLASLACVSSSAFASLVHYLPFDNTYVDQGTVGNNGTATFGHTSANLDPSFVTDVPTGLDSTHAMKLSREGARVNLPNSTAQMRLDTIGQTMSLSTWIKLDNNATSTGNASNFFGNWTSTSGWRVSVMNTGAVRFEARTSGAVLTRTTVASAVSVDAWTNLTFSFNVGTGLDIYVNGVRAGGGSFLLPAITNSDFLTFFGSGGTTTSTPATFDDFAIWDTALTAGEAAAIYKAPAALAGYDAGKLDPLFTLHRAAGSGTVTEGSLTWTYVAGFDVTGRALGDTWTDGTNQYMWLAGDAANATGLYTGSPIPEPSAFAVFAGLAAIGFVASRRRTRVSQTA